MQVLASGTGTSSWTDAFGNAGTASNTLSITEGTQAPTVVVSGSSTTLAAGQTETITFAFSGAVTGFDLADVSVHELGYIALALDDGRTCLDDTTRAKRIRFARPPERRC